MSRRTVLVCVAAAAVVAGVAALSQSKKRDAAEERPPLPPPPAEGEGPGRPPEFPPVRSDEDRIVHWVSMMQMGADDDVALAVERLRTAGPAGRRAVRDAASVAFESNAALVQQALDFLAVAPHAADAEFARRALEGSDTQSMLRALRVLVGAESPLSGKSLLAMMHAPERGGTEVRLRVQQTFVESEVDSSWVAAAGYVIEHSPPEEMAVALGALEGAKSKELLAWVSRCFGADKDVPTRLAAAAVLVAGGDTSRVEWLREVAGAAPAGPLDHADRALGILAKARDEAALARIGATAADRLAGADARIAAIRRLASYPAERVRAFLVPAAAAEEGVDLGVTIEALDLLVRGGDAEALATMSKHLREGGELQVHAAALVCGRLRRADMAPHLEAALKRESLDESVRALVLRALVLSGEVRSAETVVRAIAADRGAYDAQVSMAYNAGATLADASPTMRHELGVQTVRALSGELGELRGAGLVQALRTAGFCSGLDAVPGLSERLGHADAEVRTNAALALGHIGGRDAERDLRAAWWRWSDVETRSSIEEAMERAHYAASGAQR